MKYHTSNQAFSLNPSYAYCLNKDQSITLVKLSDEDKFYKLTKTAAKVFEEVIKGISLNLVFKSFEINKTCNELNFNLLIKSLSDQSIIIKNNESR